MKFMMHLTPAVPATPEERERLAPIAHHTDKIQELLEESVLSYRPGTRSAWPKILPGLTANEAGQNLKIGQNIGLARLMYIGKTREEAMRHAHDGSIFLFSQFHAKFAPEIPTTIEPFINAGIAFVGTIDDVKRQMEAVKEKLNPDWFLILSDQGFLLRDEMKEQMELFSTKIISEFSD